MDKHSENAKELPIKAVVDVLVVGAGTAGAPAAVAAARMGCRTMIAEQLSFPGGTATAGLVTPLMSTCIKGNPQPCSINKEIFRRMKEKGAADVDSDGRDGWFDPAMLSIVLEEMLNDAGVEVLYQTFFSDVIMDENVLKGVIVQNKGGRSVIMAKRIIDATGDADVAFRSDCPWESGRPMDHVNQPTSVRFEAAGVDTDKFRTFLKNLGQTEELDFPFFHTAMVWGKDMPLQPIFREALEKGDIEEQDGEYFQAFGMPGKPGAIAFNCPEILAEIDVTRPEYQSKAYAKGREAIQRLMHFMKKYIPGFENAWISDVAVLLGIRESRRIKGEYYLTGADILSYKKFEDAVTRSNYPVDIHGNLDAYEDFVRPELPEEQRYYEAPYRCLVPEKIENLLVAGRCVSADYVAQSALRIQPSCRALGEAAGIACAVSIKDGKTPRDVDGVKIRRIMKEKGAFL